MTNMDTEKLKTHFSELKEARQKAEMAAERKYPSFVGSQSGETRAYTVEARYNNLHPIQVHDQIFDNRWKQLHFKEGVNGVPSGDPLHPFFREMRVLTWAQAQALRWWFVAELERQALGSLCFETRIVQHKIVYSYRGEALTHFDHIGGETNDRRMHREPFRPGEMTEEKDA